MLDLEAEILSDEYSSLLPTFDCGEDDMNEYLKEYALYYDKLGDSKTTIFIDKTSNCIVSYYALKCNCMKIELNDSNSVIPAVEISRFATDKKYQGMKFSNYESDSISDYVMAQAIEDIKNVRQYSGVRAVMLFALDTPRTVRFYKNNKFQFVSSEKCVLNDTDGLQPMFAYLNKM